VIKKFDGCPCCSGKNYEVCCKPFHDGLPAPTPLALMRSRYAGYALGLFDYILKTTHPKNSQPRSIEETKKFCREVEFRGLEILNAGENTVTFRAILFLDGEDCSFTEKSLFEKVDGKWLYLSGTIEPSSKP
jgi:SEC-C motif domain protein